jgi:hypothetical protein
MNQLKTYIVIKGGLGNQLFQIATGIRYSKENNRELIINTNLITPNTHQSFEDTINRLKELFPTIKLSTENINNNIIFNKNNNIIFNKNNNIIFNKNNIVIYNECNNGAFVYNKIPIPSINILINGYFQTINYLPSRDELIKDMNIKPKNNKLEDKFKDNNYYFIHIRLGDYVNHSFHYINLDEYYNYAINQIKIKDKDAKFIICTNQYDKILQDKINKIKLNICEYDIQDNTDNEIDTLYIMMMCKGGICANSSLSWIGSYLQKDHDNIYMPYPWVNFINGFTHNTIYQVYPEYAKIYNTISKQELKRIKEN